MIAQIKLSFVVLAVLVAASQANSQDDQIPVDTPSESEALAAVVAFNDSAKDKLEKNISSLLEQARIQRQSSDELESFLREGKLSKGDFAVTNAVRVLRNQHGLSLPMLTVLANLVAGKELDEPAMDLVVESLTSLYGNDRQLAKNSFTVLTLLLARDVAASEIRQSIAETDRTTKRIKELELTEYEYFSEELSRHKHPTELTELEIRSILKDRIAYALKLLGDDQIEAFVFQIMDPVQSIRLRNTPFQKKFDPILATSQYIISLETVPSLAESLKASLESQQEKTDHRIFWGGRVAIFQTDEFQSYWCFREGQWYWTTRNSYLGTTGPQIAPFKIDFFADELQSPEFDLNDVAVRLASFRADLKQTLDSLNDSPKSFLTNSISPYIVPDLAIRSGSSIDVVTGIMLAGMEKRKKRFDGLKKDLEQALLVDPDWAFDGRVAIIAIQRDNVYRYYVWEHLEGSWRFRLGD